MEGVGGGGEDWGRFGSYVFVWVFLEELVV